MIGFMGTGLYRLRKNPRGLSSLGVPEGSAILSGGRRRISPCLKNTENEIARCSENGARASCPRSKTLRVFSCTGVTEGSWRFRSERQHKQACRMAPSRDEAPRTGTARAYKDLFAKCTEIFPNTC